MDLPELRQEVLRLSVDASVIGRMQLSSVYLNDDWPQIAAEVERLATMENRSMWASEPSGHAARRTAVIAKAKQLLPHVTAHLELLTQNTP